MEERRRRQEAEMKNNRRWRKRRGVRGTDKGGGEMVPEVGGFDMTTLCEKHQVQAGVRGFIVRPDGYIVLVSYRSDGDNTYSA